VSPGHRPAPRVPDTEEVTGSNPVAPTRMGLTRALVDQRVVLAVGSAARQATAAGERFPT
jgi:hypothetical protein